MPRKAKENEELKDTKSTSKKTPRTKSITKKSTTKKTASAKSTTKKSTTKKTASAKSTTKKATTRKTSSKKKENLVVEYYDLPQKYNQTVVKILAQTPKKLFVYWEISDEDINKYKNQYGENFFETTKPILIVHNDTLNYSFEVEINDFANSWYLHINDSKSDYRIELGRRPFEKNEKINTDYIYITQSNEIESPNDHILFDRTQKMVYFRNVKTGELIEKNVSTLSFIRNIGKIYNIYDLYKELYKNEDSIEDFSNPSSNMSSQFK